ncbi:hypothetical protein BAST_1605 [Bifidobacterium asteroides PRL2011]|nr:hypothetical protein BAST_1605 [Bifidobacterium asteroides PRL2011]
MKKQANKWMPMTTISTSINSNRLVSNSHQSP